MQLPPLPAELRALFHLMPMFWPRLWHNVMAIAPTFPYWNEYIEDPNRRALL